MASYGRAGWWSRQSSSRVSARAEDGAAAAWSELNVSPVTWPTLALVGQVPHHRPPPATDVEDPRRAVHPGPGGVPVQLGQLRRVEVVVEVAGPQGAGVNHAAVQPQPVEVPTDVIVVLDGPLGRSPAAHRGSPSTDVIDRHHHGYGTLLEAGSPGEQTAAGRMSRPDARAPDQQRAREDSVAPPHHGGPT